MLQVENLDVFTATSRRSDSGAEIGEGRSLRLSRQRRGQDTLIRALAGMQPPPGAVCVSG